jgi:hypothetical protein
MTTDKTPDSVEFVCPATLQMARPDLSLHSEQAKAELKTRLITNWVMAKLSENQQDDLVTYALERSEGLFMLKVAEDVPPGAKIRDVLTGADVRDVLHAAIKEMG